MYTFPPKFPKRQKDLSNTSPQHPLSPTTSSLWPKTHFVCDRKMKVDSEVHSQLLILGAGGAKAQEPFSRASSTAPVHGEETGFLEGGASAPAADQEEALRKGFIIWLFKIRFSPWGPCLFWKKSSYEPE